MPDLPPIRSSLIAVLVFTAVAGAEVPLRAVRVASGLSRPVYVTAPPGDTGRLFIAEQHTGQIKILNLNTGTINPTPFLDLSGLATGSEQGLLGLAFHPNYATNGLFYVNYTATGGVYDDGITFVTRYQRSAGNPDIADTTPANIQTVIRFDQPQTNHNGGWIGFGPNDGYLYIAAGDGGNFDDGGEGHTEPGGNAQDIADNPFGKILRLNVNADDFPADANRNYAIPQGGAGQPPKNPFVGVAGDDEIWSYGLRNPFRASFDRETGDFYIGDVGQGAREEIDFQPVNSTGGENYGWRLREGEIPTPGSVGGAPPPGNVEPIHTYDRDTGNVITGGYVMRSGENETLDGTYFFTDYGSQRIFSFKYDGTNKTNFHEYTGQIFTNAGTIGGIASFGEDALGRLYMVELFGGGEVYRLVPPEIGDSDFDGDVDLNDLGNLASSYGAATGATWQQGDFDDDNDVDLNDLGALATHYDGGQSQALTDFQTLISVPEPTSLTIFAGGLLLRITRRRQ